MLVSSLGTTFGRTKWLFRNWLSDMQIVEQRPSILQIERVESFSKPVIDRSDKIAGLVLLALVAPQLRHAHRRTEFPGPRLLLTRHVQ